LFPTEITYRVCGEQLWSTDENMLTGKNRRAWRNPYRSAIFPLNIPHEMVWN
jgi:hypothetical protein